MMRALDLFCGAGGATVGLQRAGFVVTGFDLKHSPRYKGDFFNHEDARRADLRGYDLIWASPPCQAFTAYRRRPDHVRPAENLIHEMREKLRDSGIPYVIENVPGAPLLDPVTLCGS